MPELRGGRPGVIRAVAVTLLAVLGLAFAAPPAGHWVRRAWSDWRGERHWDRIRTAGRPVRATDPVARLTIPEIELRQNILPGATKANLDRLPALVENSSPPVVLGHRDTHFSKLKALRPGMQIRLQNLEETREYHVADIEIHTPETLRHRIDTFKEDNVLLLSTCYPFRHIGPAPNRLLAICPVVPELDE